MPGSRVRLFASLWERQRQRALPSDEAIQVIVNAVAQAMETDVATLYVYDAGPGELVLTATRGLARSGVGFVTLKIGEGISGQAALLAIPVTRSDVTGDTTFKLIPGFDQSRYRSIMAVPVLLENEVIGALNVQSIEVRHYAPSDTNELQAIATMIAPTLKRYWTEGDLAMRLRGPKLLSSVDGIVAASLGPSQICEQIEAALNVILPEAQCALAYGTAETLVVPSEARVPAPVLAALDACVASGQEHESEQEGVAILALPLRGKHAVRGALALTASSSTEPPWRTAHVRHYVETLADQVGLALEQLVSRLPAQLLPSIDTQFFETTLYAQLLDLVLQDKGLQEVVEQAAGACGIEIGVVDVFGMPLAGTVPAEVGYEQALVAGSQALGRMLAGPSAAPRSGLDTVAQVLSLELSKWKVRFEVEAKLRGDVLDVLLSGDESEERELQARASLVGLDLRRDYVPVMFAFDTAGRLDLVSPIAMRSLMRAVHHHLGEPPDSVAFHRPEGLLVLASERDDCFMERVEKILHELRSLAGLDAIGTGIGTVARRPSDYATSVKKAMLTANLGMRFGMRKPITSGRLGVHGLLLALAESDQLKEFVDDQLGVLIGSDLKNGGELIKTLEAYHASGERLSPAAKTLFVHVNTLKYRLARIDALTERSLGDPISRFNMYLALYALRLIDPGHHTLIPDELRSLQLAAADNVAGG